MEELTTGDFTREIEEVIGVTAGKKGYLKKDRHLASRIYEEFGRGHMLGEIATKITRYNHIQNYDDLVKIAAWAFLLAREHKKERVVVDPAESFEAVPFKTSKAEAPK